LAIGYLVNLRQQQPVLQNYNLATIKVSTVEFCSMVQSRFVVAFFSKYKLQLHILKNVEIHEEKGSLFNM